MVMCCTVMFWFTTEAGWSALTGSRGPTIDVRRLLILLKDRFYYAVSLRIGSAKFWRSIGGVISSSWCCVVISFNSSKSFTNLSELYLFLLWLYGLRSFKVLLVRFFLFLSWSSRSWFKESDFRFWVGFFLRSDWQLFLWDPLSYEIL